MNRSDPAARCYAEALLLMAKEGNRLGAVLDDLRGALQAFLGDRKLWGLFTSPRIDRREKERFVRKGFEGRVGREVLGLLVTLVRKGREPIYDNIVGQFERFKDVAEGRVHVYVRSARPLAEEMRRAVETAVASASGKTVSLHQETDPALLGGISVRVGDSLVDGTLLSRLRKLGRGLVESRL